jgi:ribosomal protein S18 acetylase RimI-like enzyme
MTDIAHFRMRGRDVLIAAWRSSVGHYPDGFFDEAHGMAVAVTGLPWEANNVAWVLDDSGEDLEGALRWAIERRNGLGPGFDLPAGQHLRAERALSAIGHRVILSRPMMTARAGDLRAAVPAGLELSRVVTSADTDDVARVQGVAFSSPFEMERAQLPDGQVHDPDCFVALGRVDGEPVSAAVGVRSEHGIAIFGVATAPQWQGRGYGSATTAYAVAGFDDPAALVVLQATVSGYPVYLRMGFTDVGQWEIWSADRDDSA